MFKIKYWMYFKLIRAEGNFNSQYMALAYLKQHGLGVKRLVKDQKELLKCSKKLKKQS